jgi:hypothetical protein
MEYREDLLAHYLKEVNEIGNQHQVKHEAKS